MRLITLECDRPSFKTLAFRPEGLSILVGDAAEREGSANGVGKTLALALVHHCLGARRDHALAHGVGDWRFALSFEIDGARHRIERNGDGSDITLDGRALSDRGLREWLDRHGPFAAPPNAPGFSFRALYGRFARRSPEDRRDPVVLRREHPHEGLIRTLYLLGADISLAVRKVARRERMLQLESQIKLLRQSDARLRQLLATGTDARVQAEDLADRIKTLEAQLATMRVAENYEAIRHEADDLTRMVRQLETRLAQIDFQLAGIERMLAHKPDISREALLGLYRGLEHLFKPEALAHFEAVESFQKSLAEQRQRRLARDRLQLIAERERVEGNRRDAANRRDRLLALLKGHHALDDYLAVANRLSAMKADLDRLQRYGQAIKDWEEERLKLKEQAVQDDLEAARYLETEPLEHHSQRFREIVRMLYPHEAAGIVLENNTRDNKLRYDLKVQVQSQGSDGINAVRVMAFDWIVYRHGAHHTMRHLWHDNGLFDHVDPNQRAAWLRWVDQQLEGSGMQYILSINTENFESTRRLLAGQEALLDRAVIARLAGDADEHKLLGVRIGVVDAVP